jgi:hypothetical protein
MYNFFGYNWVRGMNALNSFRGRAWGAVLGFFGSLFGLGPNCFPPDTVVSTETGLRPIAEVQAGDRVWAYDFASGEWRLCVVECRHDSVYDGPLVQIDLGHCKVKATAHHPFWVVQGHQLDERWTPHHLRPGESEGMALAGQWVNSHELRAGDVVCLRRGEWARILRLEQWYERTPVCNLTVRGLRTFAVGNSEVLVHNSSGSPPAGPDPASQPYGGPENALRLREMTRQMLEIARQMGDGQLAGQIASQLERLEMAILRQYPGLF